MNSRGSATPQVRALGALVGGDGVVVVAVADDEVRSFLRSVSPVRGATDAAPEDVHHRVVEPLELVAIDRVRRPNRPFGDPRRFPTQDLTVGEGRGLHRVGVAFLNKDGSLSLVVDDGLRDGPKQRFQMRVRRERRSRQA